MIEAIRSHQEALFFLATLLLIFAASGVGVLFSRVLRKGAEQDSSLTQSAMLTLLSLLLAFGVSMADTRYESRKQVELEESNAIGTSYLRADLLPSPSGAALKQVLRQYLEARIEAYRLTRTDEFASLGQRLDSLQRKAWDIAGSEMVRKPSIEKSLLLTSLNEVFDLRDKQIFSFWNRVPSSIIALLYAASFLVSCLVGYLHAGMEPRHKFAVLALVFMISATLFVILDLDRPRVGLIRVNPDDLVRLRQGIANGAYT